MNPESAAEPSREELITLVAALQARIAELERQLVPRDNQGETAYCLTYECSRRCVSLPHLIVPLPHVTEC